jgi:hypothetical protein
MLEKRLKSVPPQSFTADGTANGRITVGNATSYKVKQQVFISADGLPNLELEIKHVDSANVIYVGPRNGSINTREDISAYTVALNAKIGANEQKRPSVPYEEINRAVYEEEPTVALRTIPVDRLGNPYTSINPQQVSMDAEDSFGRIKVAPPNLLFDSSFQYTLQDRVFIKQQLLGGSITHNPNRASASISCTNTIGSTSRFRSRNYFPYSPAFTNTVKGSFCFHGATNGVTKRIGLFDSKNGFIVQAKDGVVSVGIRSSVSGAPIDNFISQENWNVDKMNGTLDPYTNPSGVLMDWTKQQIFYIQYQWLGSGQVEFGFVVNGKIFKVHKFQHANNLSSLYSQTGTLPVQAEIINNSSTLPSFFEFTCCSVVSNGATSQHGHLHSVSNGTTPKSLPLSGRSYPVVSLRKKAGFTDVPVQVLDIGAFSTSQDDFIIQIIHKPTLTGAVWVDIPNSLCQKDVSATAWTGGDVVAEFYMKGNIQASEKLDLISKFWDLTLSNDFNGDSEIMSLTAIPLTTNAALYGLMSFKEFE